jgi:chromosome segregation protein
LKPGHRRALESLFGPIDQVVVVPDPGTAEKFLASSGPDEAITMLVAGASSDSVPGAQPLLSQAATVGAEAARVLGDVYLAESLPQALKLASAHPDAMFVTEDGALAMGRLVFRGSAEVADTVAKCELEIASARAAIVEIQRKLAAARARVEEARSGFGKHDATLARSKESERALERDIQGLAAEIAHLDEIKGASETALKAALERSRSLSARIDSVRSASALSETQVIRVREEHAALQAGYELAVRRAEEAQVQASVAKESSRQLGERIDRTRGLLTAVSVRLAGLGERQAALAGAHERAGTIASLAAMVGEWISAWPAEAEMTYQLSLVTLSEIDQKIVGLQQARHVGARELEELRSLARQEDLGRSELKVKQRILEARLADELHVDPIAMVARFGNQLELPESVIPEDPLERQAAQPEEVLRRRQARLERELEQMGNVNPLAAREAEALAEREEFLSTQMADVRSSRRDLRQVVESVDERIRVLFNEAFDDVAAEYERLFRVLFPSGSGRLNLTDPDDVLETGVEVEASPSGRSLKRLSLLSGGERALSALALLFAIFKARPSPFYILDEVEAALDDVNLQRFLGLLHEFRGTSQLLVVSHQKRTMEVADVLYGVAIRPDGVSKVISERLNDLFPAAPVSAASLSVNEQ